MAKLNNTELLFVNEKNSVLLIKCRADDGEPFYAYVKCEKDTYRDLKTIQTSDDKKININELGNILFFGFEENPPEEISNLFTEKRG